MIRRDFQTHFPKGSDPFGKGSDPFKPWRASGKNDFLLSSRYENGAKQLCVY